MWAPIRAATVLRGSACGGSRFPRSHGSARGRAEEIEEGLAEGGFMGDAVLVELRQGGVVGLDELLGRLEGRFVPRAMPRFHTQAGAVVSKLVWR